MFTVQVLTAQSKGTIFGNSNDYTSTQDPTSGISITYDNNFTGTVIPFVPWYTRQIVRVRKL